MKIAGFFEGNTMESMMRLGFFICIITGCACTVLIVVLGRDMTSGALLIGAVLGPAFAGKAAQGFSDRKVVDKNKANDKPL